MSKGDCKEKTLQVARKTRIKQQRAAVEWVKRTQSCFFVLKQRWNMSKVPQLKSGRHDVCTGQSKDKRAAAPTCWAPALNYCWIFQVGAYPPTALFSPLRCRLLHYTLHNAACLPTTPCFALKTKIKILLHKIKRYYLHVRVEFRDSALCNLLLVSKVDLSCFHNYKWINTIYINTIL